VIFVERAIVYNVKTKGGTWKDWLLFFFIFLGTQGVDSGSDSLNVKPSIPRCSFAVHTSELHFWRISFRVAGHGLHGHRVAEYPGE